MNRYFRPLLALAFMAVSTCAFAQSKVKTGYQPTNTDSSWIAVTPSNGLPVNIVAGAGAGGTSSNFDAAFPTAGTAIGLSDGTNMKAWLTALFLGDGVNGNNTAAVASWLWNGASYDRWYGDKTLGGWVDVKGWAGGTLGAMANYGTSPGAVLVPGVNAFVTNTNANGQATSANSSPVVIASDQSAVAVNTQPATTGGLTNYFIQPAASDNHATIKAGAGQVYKISVTNNSATVNYLRLYNATTGFNGCNSATNLVYETAIPASTSVAGIVDSWNAGLAFATGISICVTSGYAQTDTTAATASAMNVNIGYK